MKQNICLKEKKVNITHMSIRVFKRLLMNVSPHTRDFSHELGDTIQIIQ